MKLADFPRYFLSIQDLALSLFKDPPILIDLSLLVPMFIGIRRAAVVD